MTTDWIKAAASSQGGDCVELRRQDDTIEIRDSKDPHGPILHFTPRELAAFLHGAKHAEFDHLTDS